jgi:hypothetical protein
MDLDFGFVTRFMIGSRYIKRYIATLVSTHRMTALPTCGDLDPGQPIVASRRAALGRYGTGAELCRRPTRAAALAAALSAACAIESATAAFLIESASTSVSSNA